jgi:hypothetical protein
MSFLINCVEVIEGNDFESKWSPIKRLLVMVSKHGCKPGTFPVRDPFICTCIYPDGRVSVYRATEQDAMPKNWTDAPEFVCGSRYSLEPMVLALFDNKAMLAGLSHVVAKEESSDWREPLSSRAAVHALGKLPDVLELCTDWEDTRERAELGV